MKTLILTAAVLLMVPTLRAQQAEADKTTPQPAPQAAPQVAAENPSTQSDLPEAIRPGHPLDPADVDILTGKRDREIEAARRGIPQVVMGGYGAYGDPYAVNGRRSGTFDLPLLPLQRISNPFFFFNIPPRNFGSRGLNSRNLGRR